ncbi:MAG: glycosyltransferase family A protein, partial [Cyanobacteriota bacterium]|nr:glycosyltransferase family A protein [Cyanobacteriota bacterium]
DNTRELILNYKDLFEKKGFSFEYHYHKNIGPGGTIAEGITYVNGDYLVWPDVDDEMTPDSISKKVLFLERNAQFGIVRTDFMRIFVKDGKEIKERGAQHYSNKFKAELFLDYLLSNEAWLQPGCFMVAMKAFLSANPERYIFPTRRGQNWQMLLPVLFKYKCGYIDEPLYNYYVHVGSVSNPTGIANFTTEITKIEKYNELIVDTLSHMEMDEKERQRYIAMVNNKYLKEKLAISFRFGKTKDAKRYYALLKKEKQSTLKDYFKTKKVFMLIFHAIRKI